MGVLSHTSRYRSSLLRSNFTNDAPNDSPGSDLSYDTYASSCDSERLEVTRVALVVARSAVFQRYLAIFDTFWSVARVFHDLTLQLVIHEIAVGQLYRLIYVSAHVTRKDSI